MRKWHSTVSSITTSKEEQLQVHIPIDKAERQQRGNAFGNKNALCSIKQNTDRDIKTLFHTRNNLSTSPARRNGLRHKTFTFASSNCQCNDWLFGMLCPSSKECRPLGTQTRGISSILLIGSNDNCAVL